MDCTNKKKLNNVIIIPKQALQYRPKGRRNIGQPRERWKDQLHHED
jgi:hypothetical protein